MCRPNQEILVDPQTSGPLLAAGDTSASPLILDARVRQSAADGEVTVEFQLPLESAEGEAPGEGNQACRLSRAWLVEGKTPQIEQQTVSCLAVDQTLTGSVAVEASADSELLALVVEHLASGAWGAEIFEIDSAPS